MARQQGKVIEIDAASGGAQASSKRPYVRQADIPKITLEEALKLPQALQDNFAGRPTTPPQLVSALNLSIRSRV